MRFEGIKALNSTASYVENIAYQAAQASSGFPRATATSSSIGWQASSKIGEYILEIILIFFNILDESSFGLLHYDIG